MYSYWNFYSGYSLSFSFEITFIKNKYSQNRERANLTWKQFNHGTFSLIHQKTINYFQTTTPNVYEFANCSAVFFETETMEVSSYDPKKDRVKNLKFTISQVTSYKPMIRINGVNIIYIFMIKARHFKVAFLFYCSINTSQKLFKNKE